MTERASPEGFNPRFVIKDVLKAVIATYADDLRAGRFPPPALLDHFKGPKLSAAVKADLARLDPSPSTRERRLTLLDLWTTGGRVTDLSPGLHEAFGLPVLGTPAAQPATAETPAPRPAPDRPSTESAPTKTAPGLPDKLETQLRQLDEWQNGWSSGWRNGGKLPQNLVNALREAVFDAVKARINWDAEILVEGFFSGQEPKKPFRQRSVNFEGQSTQRTQAVVQLTIPTDQKSYEDTAIALQGLLLFAHHGSWRFQFGGHTGSYFLRTYAEQLDGWARIVLDQLRRPTSAGNAWDPAPAAAELLALAARMGNRPVASKTAPDDHLSAIFAGIDGVEFDHRAPAWREVAKALRNAQPALAELLLSHVGCTKGGSRRVQVVDASRLLDTLRGVRKDWRPKEPVPPEAWDTYAPIRKAREKVDALLAQAVDEERTRHVSWLDRFRDAIGAESTRDEVVTAVREAMQAARDEGVFAGVSRERIEAALDAFGRVRLDQCLEAIGRMRGEAEPGALLVELGRDYGDLMKTADEFVSLTTQFLEGSRRRVDTEMAQLAGAGELKAVEQAIAQNLDQLHALVGELAGGAP